MKNLKYKQQGFTIVELVIVMVVIGILSAVALPRMVNLAKEARKNTHLAVVNNFITSIQLLRSQWIAASEPDVIQTSDGISIFMGHNVGFPLHLAEGASNPPIPDDCINLWNAVLKNPPLASTEVGCAVNGTCKYELLLNKFYSEEGVMSCVLTDKDGNALEYSYNAPSSHVFEIASHIFISLHFYNHDTEGLTFLKRISL